MLYLSKYSYFMLLCYFPPLPISMNLFLFIFTQYTTYSSNWFTSIEFDPFTNDAWHGLQQHSAVLCELCRVQPTEFAFHYKKTFVACYTRDQHQPSCIVFCPYAHRGTLQLLTLTSFLCCLRNTRLLTLRNASSVACFMTAARRCRFPSPASLVSTSAVLAAAHLHHRYHRYRQPSTPPPPPLPLPPSALACPQTLKQGFAAGAEKQILAIFVTLQYSWKTFGV